MAQTVARAIAARSALIAEAGTGTGKTFAYLVPALLYGGKVIVSTGTKTLQDQLFQRDLPAVRDALSLPVTLALLKGRANYVCHHHLARAVREGRLPSREDARHLPKIVAFARASDTGDRGELADVPRAPASGRWSPVTRDNCLGSDCAHHDDCFVLKARKAALDADVVVVNHHLFFADVMLRDEGLTELLPACNTIVLDEAHQLPDTATLFFGESIAAGQLAELARDAEVAARTDAREVAGLPDAMAGVGPAIRRLKLALGEAPMKIGARLCSRARGFPRRRWTNSRRRSIALPPNWGFSRNAARHWATAQAAPPRHRGWCRAGATGRAGRGRRVRRRDVDPLGGRHAIELATAGLAVVGGQPLCAAGERFGPRVDIDVGNARRRARFFALPEPTRARRGPHRLLGFAVRLRLAGPAVRAPWAAGTQFARAHRGRHRRRLAGAEGERRAGLSCCSPRCAR